ncbi:pentapeptide repeat-containing protein [Streptomyces sp. NPDC001635]
MSAAPIPVPPAPSWPHCGHNADPVTDPVGCRGIHVRSRSACLAHLAEADRDAYLAGLTPGADIDHRGTPFTEPLLSSLLSALRDPVTLKPHLGTAEFSGAQFTGDARFGEVHFTGDAWFTGAHFTGDARFDQAEFTCYAGFSRVNFTSEARFGRARFIGEASFSRAHFNDGAEFTGAQFTAAAWFGGVEFSGTAAFGEVQFIGDAEFSVAQFGSGWRGTAEFSGAQFTGTARFDQAEFAYDAGFREARFSGIAQFSDATFSETAEFDKTRFNADAWFSEVEFSGTAGFSEVEFSGSVGFSGAQFSGAARFSGAQFSGAARFSEAQFSGLAAFDGAQLTGDAVFGRTRFAGPLVGPVVCSKVVELSGAVFEVPVTLEIAAPRVRCVRTWWGSTATVRLRYATVDLSHAVLASPVAITAHPTPFTNGGDALDESTLAGCSDGVRIASIQGADAAHLVLTDTDLTSCLFSGAFHLDQLRLEGRCTFAPTPTGWHRRGIWLLRWTRRRTLAEEHHWRAQTAWQTPLPSSGVASPRQWHIGPHHPDPDLTPDPEDVAALYRQLRKAFEDGKNEPGAADFYYGEMEMRRNDRTSTPSGERRLLWGYWLLSGYGLRSSRAFTWLLAAMALTLLLLMGLGLPTHDPDPATTGNIHGSKIALNTSTPDPALHGGLHQRMTWARAEKATRVAVNSVIFRSSGQNLTIPGTYIEMASRLFEPTLLALGVLAIRGRIKR